MVTFIMSAMALGIALAAFASKSGMTPDVERIAGRYWADVAKTGFETCPRANGFRFWMGCTDQAAAEEPPR